MIDVPNRQTVTGLAVIGTKLIVTQSRSSCLEIFEGQSAQLCQFKDIQGMSDPYDAVGHDGFLYVSERTEKKMHRIQLGSGRGWSCETVKVE